MKKGAPKKLGRKKPLRRNKPLSRASSSTVKKATRKPGRPAKLRTTLAPRIAVNPPLMSKHDVPRPFVKWAGGKRQILAALAEHVPPEFGTYHEPFVGGGALFFFLKPRRARLTDSNERLVRTWRGVKNDVERVIAELARHDKQHGKDYYYQQRGVDVDALDDATLAAWFIYMNKTGFNGLYRVNSRNVFNVPFGRHVNPTICDRDNLIACSRVLQEADAIIEVGDFGAVNDHARPGDFVYFDPPYVPVSRTAYFTAYTADRFGPADQERLRDVARQLKTKGVQVLLSNSSAQLVHELYGVQPFRIDVVQATRNVNSRADRRGPVAEVIIY